MCRLWSSPASELTPEEDARLHTLARSIVVKGVESPERLLDETSLFLHRVVTRSARRKAAMLERFIGPTRTWLGRRPARGRRRSQHLRALQRA